MENKKMTLAEQDRYQEKISGIITALMAICGIVSIVAVVLAIADNNTSVFVFVDNLVKITASAVGLMYGVNDCAKGVGGRFYKAFYWLYALTYLCMFFNPFFKTNYFMAALIGIQIAIIVILAFAKDLGEKRSKALNLAVIGINCVYIILALVLPGAASLDWFGFVANLLLSGAAYAIVFAKYVDKKLRGRA